MKNYICVDIGGTSIKYSIIDEKDTIVTNGQIDTEAFKGGKHVIDRVRNIVGEYLSQYKVEGICVSSAGMVDPVKGEIIFASERIPNYTGTKIKEYFEKVFELPCEVENDVNCAGLSESILGAGKNAGICVCMTIGTGIGGCITIDKKVFHGFSNSACEVGYLSMGNSIFQDEGATSALVKRTTIRKNMELGSIDGKWIFDEAKKGDVDCIEEISRMVNILADGIANICYVINPQMIILGGGIMAQREYLGDRIRLALKEKLIESIYKNTEIAFAQNGNNAGMLGARYHFIQRQSEK